MSIRLNDLEDRMKRLKLFTIFLVFLFTVASFGDHGGHQNFLATDYASIAADGTYTKTTWTTDEMLVVPSSWALITVTFTTAGGDGNEIEFYFQVSCDNGATWTTTYWTLVSVDSDEDAVANVVRYPWIDIYPGISHIRLWKIYNGDQITAITDVNASLSWGRVR